MSDDIVVDASVALKWVFDEEFSDHARALLRRETAEARTIAAPVVFLSQATNAVFQRERRALITSDEGDTALASLLASPLELHSPPALYRQALDVARRYNLRATYDAQYVALAALLGANFWTADERLFNALSPSLPSVRLLADYEIDPSG